MQHQDEIRQVSIQAAQESNLKQQLHTVKGTWTKMELLVKEFKGTKDVYILDDLEELLNQLDESLATLSTIVGNQYVGAIRDQVELWQKQLNLMQDILDEWITCQKNWIYMYNIFSGGSDIKKQLAQLA